MKRFVALLLACALCATAGTGNAAGREKVGKKEVIVERNVGRPIHANEIKIDRQAGNPFHRNQNDVEIRVVAPRVSHVQTFVAVPAPSYGRQSFGGFQQYSNVRVAAPTYTVAVPVYTVAAPTYTVAAPTYTVAIPQYSAPVTVQLPSAYNCQVPVTLQASPAPVTATVDPCIH